MCNSRGATPLYKYKKQFSTTSSSSPRLFSPCCSPQFCHSWREVKSPRSGTIADKSSSPSCFSLLSFSWMTENSCALSSYRSSRGSCYLLRYDHGLCHFTRTQPKNRTGGRVKSNFVALWTSGTCVSRQQGLTPKTLCPKFLVGRKLPDRLWDLRVIPSRSCTCPPSCSPIAHVHILQCFCWLCHLNCVTVSLNGSVDVAAHVCVFV